MTVGSGADSIGRSDAGAGSGVGGGTESAIAAALPSLLRLRLEGADAREGLGEKAGSLLRPEGVLWEDLPPSIQVVNAMLKGLHMTHDTCVFYSPTDGTCALRHEACTHACRSLNISELRCQESIIAVSMSDSRICQNDANMTW